MDLYSVKSKSIPQKIVIITIEVFLLLLAYWILFKGGGELIFDKTGLTALDGNWESRVITFSFSVIVFLRMSFMMLYLLKRKIPWEESVSVPMAFSLYYIGFALLVYNRDVPIDWIDYSAVLLFLIGSAFNTVSEVQRHLWKKHPENKGKLYTIGLFKYSMHINFFGDLVWVSAYAIITRNYYAIIIPVLLFCLFAFWNIPALDKYLAGKYKDQFKSYQAKTKKLIPFIY
jgi:protein-S-isoprenylcysteine O-methyltransferase Ste14